MSLINNKINLFTKLTTGFIFTKAITKSISDKVISDLIESAKDELKSKICDWYANYKKNIIISFILGLSVVLLSIITTIFFTMNKILITIIASITIFTFTRFIYLAIKNIFRIFPFRNDILIFINDFILNKSLRIAINESIRFNFRRIYQGKTNEAGRITHTIGSTIGFIKSKDNIEDDVVKEIYPLIRNYAIENISYKTIAFLAYCIIFTFILRPFVFQYTMDISVTDVVFYPFTVTLPAIIEIIRQILQ